MEENPGRENYHLSTPSLCVNQLFMVCSYVLGDIRVIMDFDLHSGLDALTMAFLMGEV